ncbi:very short patch repair endonuclease [Qipengyuania flava]|uniref:very short patch repair endonuclease n=1 Tax=Qipengyuania flava TaxID=192812 RepID=UPI00102E4B79|nr:very short patch repair endonuclease [Qipengyuania flava]
MADIVSKEARSRMMAGIRSGNTKPELLVRKYLHAVGFRYSLRKRRDLPCQPDIVLPKYRAAVFVHGCFWHRHQNCRYATTPKSNAEFWSEKFRANVERDNRCEADLTRMGWRVNTVWECELKEDAQARLADLTEWLRKQ